MLTIREVEEISQEDFEEAAGKYEGFLIGICLSVEEDQKTYYLYVANPAFIPRPGETYISYEQLNLMLKKNTDH